MGKLLENTGKVLLIVELIGGFAWLFMGNLILALGLIISAFIIPTSISGLGELIQRTEEIRDLLAKSCDSPQIQSDELPEL